MQATHLSSAKQRRDVNEAYELLSVSYTTTGEATFSSPVSYDSALMLGEYSGCDGNCCRGHKAA